jgi:hypothetical protein
MAFVRFLVCVGRLLECFLAYTEALWLRFEEPLPDLVFGAVLDMFKPRSGRSNQLEDFKLVWGAMGAGDFIEHSAKRTPLYNT